MLYIYIINNYILEEFNILKQQYKDKYLFLYSDYNNDSYTNMLCKIETFIKVINNSKKDVIFFNGFFIKPSQLYYHQYNNINNIIKNKLKKKINYIYIKRDPYMSLLKHVNSIKNTCCICLEEDNDIILNCSRCNEGMICYNCYTKYHSNTCCICDNDMKTNIIKKKEIEFYYTYYDNNIYLQNKKNVIVI